MGLGMHQVTVIQTSTTSPPPRSPLVYCFFVMFKVLLIFESISKILISGVGCVEAGIKYSDHVP